MSSWSCFSGRQDGGGRCQSIDHLRWFYGSRPVGSGFSPSAAWQRSDNATEFISTQNAWRTLILLTLEVWQ